MQLGMCNYKIIIIEILPEEQQTNKEAKNDFQVNDILQRLSCSARH